jgi:hypothetical protein
MLLDLLNEKEYSTHEIVGQLATEIATELFIQSLDKKQLQDGSITFTLANQDFIVEQSFSFAEKIIARRQIKG